MLPVMDILRRPEWHNSEYDCRAVCRIPKSSGPQNVDPQPSKFIKPKGGTFPIPSLLHIPFITRFHTHGQVIFVLLTMTSAHISSAAVMSRPTVSSPLAGNSSPVRVQTAAQCIAPRRNASFPSSRALRPFPSIAQSLHPCNDKKAVKIIEAPKYQQTMFVLDLTQAEFSRQD